MKSELTNRKIRLKVCGMRDRENILEVAALNPDLMGFIFYRGTPRFVGDNFVIPETLPSNIQRVGVFVKESTDEILKKVEAFRLNFVQLHGGESAEQCRALKGRGIGVIKVFSVDESMDFSALNEFADCADYFLFDTKGKHYGGNARRFDWKVLDGYDLPIPFFLSGGIGPEHIEEVNQLQHPRLSTIDINSGVEIQPGLKDVNKIKAVTDALKIKI